MGLLASYNVLFPSRGDLRARKNLDECLDESLDEYWGTRSVDPQDETVGSRSSLGWAFVCRSSCARPAGVRAGRVVREQDESVSTPEVDAGQRGQQARGWKPR